MLNFCQACQPDSLDSGDLRNVSISTAWQRDFQNYAFQYDSHLWLLSTQNLTSLNRDESVKYTSTFKDFLPKKNVNYFISIYKVLQHVEMAIIWK